MSEADAQPDPPVVDRHAETLRHLCARLTAIGTPAAVQVMEDVANTASDHLDAVEMAFSFVEAAEAAATAH